VQQKTTPAVAKGSTYNVLFSSAPLDTYTITVCRQQPTNCNAIGTAQTGTLTTNGQTLTFTTYNDPG
jgi:hypothetical protein